MENKPQKDIFISYNWGIKNQVKILYDVLKNLKYDVWLDDRELSAGNSSLTAELASAIKNSKVFLSCVTEKYCKSFNCNLEFEYASAKKKPTIVLMVEKLDPLKIDEIEITDRNQTSGIGFLIT